MLYDPRTFNIPKIEKESGMKFVYKTMLQYEKQVGQNLQKQQLLFQIGILAIDGVDGCLNAFSFRYLNVADIAM